MNLKFEKIINKIYAKQKVSYEEFIALIEFGYEMQFFYGKRKFGSTQFDGFSFMSGTKKKAIKVTKPSKNLQIKSTLTEHWLKIYGTRLKTSTLRIRFVKGRN